MWPDKVADPQKLKEHRRDLRGLALDALADGEVCEAWWWTRCAIAAYVRSIREGG